MYLPNSKEYQLTKIEFQKKLKAIEKEFEEYKIEVVKTLPVKAGDIIKCKDGETYKITRVEIWYDNLYYNIVKSLNEPAHFQISVERKLKSGKWAKRPDSMVINQIIEINGQPFSDYEPYLKGRS